MDDGSLNNLGTWVIRQRTSLTDGILKEDRKRLLDDLGFVWKIDHYDVDMSLRARQWEEMYTKMQAFKETHRHCQIPVNCKYDPALGKWVRNQRAFERTGQLAMRPGLNDWTSWVLSGTRVVLIGMRDARKT
eukprot:scaffold90482_cov52-Attheya_sp.AAC.2